MCTLLDWLKHKHPIFLCSINGLTGNRRHIHISRMSFLVTGNQICRWIACEPTCWEPYWLKKKKNGDVRALMHSDTKSWVRTMLFRVFFEIQPNYFPLVWHLRYFPMRSDMNKAFKDSKCCEAFLDLCSRSAFEAQNLSLNETQRLSRWPQETTGCIMGRRGVRAWQVFQR